MRKVPGHLSALGALILLAIPAAALSEDVTAVGATVYYDYFMNVTDGSDRGDEATSGFEFRRVYLTVKRGWGDVLFRYTADLDVKSGTGNLNVYSKYAYLQHEGLVPGAKILIGQHSPETHGFIEKRWRFRSVAKTMSDEQKWTHAAQFGVGLQGKVMEKKVEYYLDVNNGNGYKEPVSKNGRGFAARLAVRPAGGLWVSGLANADAPGGMFSVDETSIDLDRFNTYYEGLVGWDADAFSAFVQLGRFTDAQWTGGGLNAAGGLDSRTSSGFSGFGRAKLSDRLWALGRVDRVDPDTDRAGDAFRFLLVGLDWQIHEGFYLQPNLQVTNYDAEGVASSRQIVVTVFGTI